MIENPGLFNFFEVNVGHAVAITGIRGRTCFRTGLLSLSLSVEDVLLSGAECGFDVFDCGIDSVDVLSLVGFFKGSESCFDLRFLISGDLVAGRHGMVEK